MDNIIMEATIEQPRVKKRIKLKKAPKIKAPNPVKEWIIKVVRSGRGVDSKDANDTAWATFKGVSISLALLAALAFMIWYCFLSENI